MEAFRETRKKDYSWVLPLIGGILTIIGILLPTAYFTYSGTSWTWWVWNLTVMSVSGYGSESVFISEIDFIIPSMITSITISLSAINLLILSYRTKEAGLNKRDFLLWSLLSSGATIGVMIYYINAMQLAFFDGVTIEGEIFPAGYSFWQVFSPGFGVILPFISSILAGIGVGVFLYSLKQNERMIEHYTPVSIPIGNLNYCPQCGFKLIKPDLNFCTNCGFKL
jgi:hypothetical protein